MTDTSHIKIPPVVRLLMIARWVFSNWLWLWAIIFSIFNFLPILAPISLDLGFAPLGNNIHALYHNISHQFAHRSYFLFGEQVSYSVSELPLTLTGDFLPDSNALSQFIGDDRLGWKLAWSDRLVSMYGAALITTFFYILLHQRKGFRPLSLSVMLLMIVPLIIDGTTHAMSDAESLTAGFRWDNTWLANLTGNRFSDSFYVGDAFGSFNSLMRLITGILFGIGFMAWGLGIAEPYFQKNAAVLRERLDNWKARQLAAEDASSDNNSSNSA